MRADMVVHPAIDERDARDRARVRERMPRASERDGVRRHLRVILLQSAVDEQKTKGLIDIGARGSDIAVRRFAAAIARDDVAIIEDRLTGTENEIDVSP